MSSSYLTKALRNTFLHYATFWYLFLIDFAIIILPLKKNTHSLELKFIWKYYKKDQISGYKIFCREEGQNYNYSSPTLEVTDPNFTNCSIPGLRNNTTYCFVSRAYDIFNKDSFDSNEVCFPLKDCTIYEDAEEGNIDGWIIYDQDPSGAFISNVFDKNRQSRVIELLGIPKDFIYLLQDVDWNKWDNSGQFVAHWSMQYFKYFIIYFDVNTTAGDKYLYYTAIDSDRLGDARFVHHGLGSGTADGQWHSFRRDLQADLEEAQPGVSILRVNGFMVYGSGRVDDIKLCNALQY